MDQLELEIINDIRPGRLDGIREVCMQIKIDGRLITSGLEYPIDVIQLNKSVAENGDLDIWTCSCGVPMCAGIATRVRINHEKNIVKWRLIDLPFTNDAEYVFDEKEYKSTIHQGWQNFKNAISKNKEQKIKFEIYPDPRFTGIDKKLKEEDLAPK